MTEPTIDPSLKDHTIKVYAALLQCWRDHGQSPSYQNLEHACGISAPTVRKAVKALKEKGYVLAPKFQARSIKPTDLDRVLLNKVPNPWDSLAPPKKYFKVKQ